MRTLLLGILVTALFACQPSPEKSNTDKENITIVCTTGLIADVTRNLVGDEAEVIALMGPGVDPHLYKATQGDLERLNEADVILYNGLHLEGKMGSILEKIGKRKPTIPVAEVIDDSRLNILDDGSELKDPHVWFDVEIWRDVTAGIRDTLFQIYPDFKAVRADQAEAYLQQLTKLDSWVQEEVNKIPEIPRVLVTAHDAFEYFSDAYGIKVRGLQGLSTVAEYSLKDVTDLVDFIIERKIPAIFLENIVPERSIQAVIEGCEKQGYELRLGGTLFTDALGEEGTAEGSYVGMIQFNVNLMRDALSSEFKKKDS